MESANDAKANHEYLHTSLGDLVRELRRSFYFCSTCVRDIEQEADWTKSPFIKPRIVPHHYSWILLSIASHCSRHRHSIGRSLHKDIDIFHSEVGMFICGEIEDVLSTSLMIEATQKAVTKSICRNKENWAAAIEAVLSHR